MLRLAIVPRLGALPANRARGSEAVQAGLRSRCRITAIALAHSYRCRTMPTRKGTTPERQPDEAHAPGRTTVEEHLLDPFVSRAIQGVRSGAELQRRETALTIGWSPEALRRITEWLWAGAPADALAKLLADDPVLIGHPFVFRQFLHLRRLRRLTDEADLAAGFSTNSEYVPPAGTRRGAEQALQKLVEAWVLGALGQGWSVKPPPKRRGRKRTIEDITDDFFLLGKYEEVLRRLRRDPVRQSNGESREQWVARLCDLVQRAWEESGVSRDLDTLDGRIIGTTLPLPTEQAKAWVEEALAEAGWATIRDRLAYAMVGYRWELTPDQVRARVRSARQLR